MAKKSKKVEIKKTDAGPADMTPASGAGLVHDIEDRFSKMMQRWPWFGRGHLPDAGEWFGDFRFPELSFKDLNLPRVDVTEADTCYELTAELPGMTEKDVQCSLSGNVLTVKGEKREEKEEEKKGYHMKERRYGSFERRFGVPDDVDRDGLEAKVSNGVLTVTMPRRANAEKPRDIEVKG